MHTHFLNIEHNILKIRFPIVLILILIFVLDLGDFQLINILHSSYIPIMNAWKSWWVAIDHQLSAEIKKRGA